jgi:hypothetical protein
LTRWSFRSPSRITDVISIAGAGKPSVRGERGYQGQKRFRGPPSRFCLPIISALLASGCLSVADHGAVYKLPVAVERSPDTIIWPGWAARGPAASEFRRVYPEGAKAAGLSGLVHLRCTVETALTFACDVEQETPAVTASARPRWSFRGRLL